MIGAGELRLAASDKNRLLTTIGVAFIVAIWTVGGAITEPFARYTEWFSRGVDAFVPERQMSVCIQLRSKPVAAVCYHARY